MIGVPGSLRWRLALTCCLAVLAIAALELWLRNAPPAKANAAGIAAPALPLPALPPGLQATAGPIPVFADLRAVPADAGPVVQILPDATVALRRGAAPANGPRVSAGRPAVVLPAPRLSALSANQRLALLELLGALCRDRPVAAARLELIGVAAGEGEVARLASWVP